MAEKLQDLGNTFHQTFFQTYWIHSSYAVLYVILENLAVSEDFENDILEYIKKICCLCVVVFCVCRLFPGRWSCNRAGEGSITNFR